VTRPPQTPGPGRSAASNAVYDPIKLSFLFMGCNRIQHADWKANKHDDPSSANLPQLSRSFEDIDQLRPRPPYLFFCGDLVVNLEDDDGKVLQKQLDAWTALYSASPLAGKVTLIPLPGNHEMLKKVDEDKDNDDKIEVPNPATGERWVKWLYRSKFDAFAKLANGPSRDHPESDHLADDQSQLTYSFDIGDVHFVVLNTDSLTTVIDPATRAPYIGWVPYDWIAQDVRRAQASPKVSAVFLLGHKPIASPPSGQENTILNTTKFPLGDKLQQLFQANDKVRAYLCAHEHLWDCSRFEKAPRVWQVVAGNAGSLLNRKWVPRGGTFFGFSQINVYTSGKVGLISYQRPTPPLPQKYFEATPAPPPPAKPQPEVLLTSGSQSGSLSTTQ